jgi:hypothetical protein
MGEGPAAPSALSGDALLELAVDTLLAESPAELPEQVALDAPARS